MGLTRRMGIGFRFARQARRNGTAILLMRVGPSADEKAIAIAKGHSRAGCPVETARTQGWNGAGSSGSSSPPICALSNAALPQASVKPSAPWPMFSHRLSAAWLRPISGLPLGVAGRSPAQNGLAQVQAGECLVDLALEQRDAFRVDLRVAAADVHHRRDAHAATRAYTMRRS